MPIQIQDIHDQDDIVDCPLCMETLEVDDINFFPCECAYQICRFCWHRIRTDGNGLCPACRKPYPENPAEFKPLTDQELQKIRQDKKQKEVARKQKITDSRKHLANVRVLQKNLVFVVGLSQRLADVEILKRPEYFGKYGKILKVVLNSNTSYAGSQSPSCSAYVTYSKMEEALRAIQSVNNVHIDGRTLKASLGTTKYCSNYLKNQVCQKHDCMYLHEIGDEDASFTKEDMQMAKHQEYEQKLIQQMIQKEIQQEMKSKAMRQEGISESEDGYTGTSPPSSASTITSSLSVAQAVKKNTKMAGESVGSHARRHSISASSDTPEIQETDAQSKNSSKGLKLSSSVGDKDSGGGKATNSSKASARRTTGGKKNTVPPTSQAPRHKKQQQQNTSTKKISSLECASTSTDDVANISGSAETSVESSPSLTPVQNESLSSVRTPHGSASSEMFSSNQDASFSEDSLSAIRASALPIDIPVLTDDLNRTTPLSDSSSSIGRKSPYVREGVVHDSNTTAVVNSAETNNSGTANSRFMMFHKEGTAMPGVISNGLGFSPFGMNPTTSSLFQDLHTPDSSMTNNTQPTSRMMPPPGLSSIVATGSSNWPVQNSRLPDSMPIQSSHDWEAAFGFKSSAKETISSGDDDLGFDPWLECSKGLADLMKEEKTMNSSSVASTYNQIPPAFSNMMSQPRRPTYLHDRNQPKPPQMGYPGGSDLINGFSNLFSTPTQMYQQNKMPYPSEQSRFLPQQRLGPDPSHQLFGQNNSQKLLSPGSPVTPTKDPLILKGNNGNLQDMQNEFRALLPSVNINFTNQNHLQRFPAGHNNLDLSLGLSNLGMPMGAPKHPISHPPGIGNMPMQNHPFMNRQHSMPPGGFNRSALIRQQWGNSDPGFPNQGMSSNRVPGPISQHSLFPNSVAGSESEPSQNYPPDPAIIHGGVQGFGQNPRRNRLFESSFARPMSNANNNAVDEQPHWMKSLQAMMEQDTPTSPGLQPPSSLGQGFSQQRTNTSMPSWPTMTGLFPSNNNSTFSNSQPPPGFQVRPSLTKPTEFGALQNLLENQS